MATTNIEIRSVPTIRVACLRSNLNNFREQGPLWQELLQYLDQANVEPCAPTVMVLHSPGPIDVEICAPIADSVELPLNARISVRVLPEISTAACYVHQGKMEDITQAYEHLVPWVKDNGYVVNAPSREVYVDIPRSKGSKGGDWNAVKVEVYFPISKAS